MPRLPAACPSCGTLYPAPLRARDLESDTAFEVPVPCPSCGSGGRVPAEVLRRLVGLVGTLEEVAPEEERLADFLESVRRICREAGDREEVVLDALRADPGLGRLAGALPGATPGQMVVFLPLVRSLAAELRGAEAPGAGEASAFELVEAVLDEAYEERAADSGEVGEPEEVVRARRRLDAAGRNDPCPCGSGDKYKDCHWMADLRRTRG